MNDETKKLKRELLKTCLNADKTDLTNERAIISSTYHFLWYYV